MQPPLDYRGSSQKGKSAEGNPHYYVFQANRALNLDHFKRVPGLRIISS